MVGVRRGDHHRIHIASAEQGIEVVGVARYVELGGECGRPFSVNVEDRRQHGIAGAPDCRGVRQPLNGSGTDEADVDRLLAQN
jgi:hypothetical protein